MRVLAFRYFQNGSLGPPNRFPRGRRRRGGGVKLTTQLRLVLLKDNGSPELSRTSHEHRDSFIIYLYHYCMFSHGFIPHDKIASSKIMKFG
jgi:hypothetical protein